MALVLPARQPITNSTRPFPPTAHTCGPGKLGERRVLLLSSSSPTLASMIARHPSQEAPRNSLPSSSGSRSASLASSQDAPHCPREARWCVNSHGGSPRARRARSPNLLAVCLPIVTPRRYPAAPYHTSAPQMRAKTHQATCSCITRHASRGRPRCLRPPAHPCKIRKDLCRPPG